MPDFDADGPDEILAQEAEELMRQRRFRDAVSRYVDLRRQSPTDMWADLGYVSALECAGDVAEAEKTLEEVALNHRRSAALHRFRHLFFIRREDMRRAQASRSVVQDLADEGPADQLADMYFNQGRYHEALAEFERLARDIDLEESGMRAGILARSGACMRQMGQHEEARERLIAALAVEPGNPWTLAELAECERALGNVVAARRRYREALEANGDDQWTRGHLAQLEYEDGHPDQSVILYRQIIETDPKAIWAKVELAQVLAETDPEESIKLCHSALEDDPTYPWALAHLGNMARRAGRLDEARKHYQDAAASSPNATWVLHELADTCRRLGRREEAYTHLEHAQRHNPYDAVTYGYLADFLRQDNRSKEAIAHLEKAVQLDQAYAWAWRELAELRGIEGRHADADLAFGEAEALEPGAAVNDGLKAFLLRCRGDRSASVPWLERAVSIQPDYLWAWRELIDWYLLDSQDTRAETAARTALEQIPESAPLLSMLAESLRRQGKISEAEQTLSGILAAGTEHPQAWVVQAQILAGKGDVTAALPLMQRAYALDACLEHRALLAQLLISNEEYEAASPLVRSLLDEAKPVQPAFELGAVLAERRKNTEDGLACCETGLAIFPNDPRLLVRRARIQHQRDGSLKSEDAAPLIALVTRATRATIPWREVAQMLAQAGHGAAARLAVARLLGEASGNQADEARAWLALSEIELGLDNLAAASQALEQSLARDRTLITGHLIGAVLADLSGKKESSAAHLKELEALVEKEIEEGEGPERFIQLEQQVAGLWERLGNHEAARATWLGLVEVHTQRLDIIAERASYLLRTGGDEEADKIATTLLPMAVAEGVIGEESCQRFMRDLAVRRASRQSPKHAVEFLVAYNAYLSAPTRALCAQIALVAEELDECDRQLSAIEKEQGAEGMRPAGLIRARLHLARHQYPQAEISARELWNSEHEQEAATVLGEALAGRGRYGEALAIVEHADLPQVPSVERGLLATVLAFELHGEAAGLVRLGRVRADRRSGLMRLFAAAWPSIWVERMPLPVEDEDTSTMPPFIHAAHIVAAALDTAGHHALAAKLLETVADNLAESVPSAALGLRLAAIASLRRAGLRWQAMRLAWSLREWGAWIRCCMPQ